MPQENESAASQDHIAAGEYESSKEDIICGFKVFRKRYVRKRVISELALVIAALLSQLYAVFSAPEGTDTSFAKLLIIICAVIGVYIPMRQENILRRLDRSLDELKGTRYEVKIYTDRIIITTIYDPYIEKSESGEENMPPATVIHLDNSAVEIVECSGIYVVYIKRENLFVIPKSAFDGKEALKVRQMLTDAMGARYISDTK